MIRAHMLISGFVQGVCYRWFVEKEATSLGLTGYVKNRYNGKVEVVVEGERGLIEEFIKALKVGPSSADVRDIKIEWQEYKGEFSGFGIRF